ncbi:MAG TPA: VOC family protein [Candidatus Polarisedimenticolia bacterium]|nr:VOC family protein [Candidatus Polarisedimenticolia bacterium]
MTFLALLVLALAAATPAPAAVPVLSVSGAFFALSVPDARKSASWYGEKLGLTVVMDPPKHGKSKVIVLEGGGLIVELIQEDDAVPLGATAPGARSPMQVHGIAKAGVIVSDFEATLAALRQKKVEIAYGPYPAGKGQRANCIIRDGDGNLIQLSGRS